LEKTKGAIKNEQSRYTGHTRDRRKVQLIAAELGKKRQQLKQNTTKLTRTGRRQTKHNFKHNTESKKTTRPHQKPRANISCINPKVPKQYPNCTTTKTIVISYLIVYHDAMLLLAFVWAYFSIFFFYNPIYNIL